MKKIILAAAAIFAFGYAHAQDSDGMKFGVKAGLNMTNFTGDFDSDGTTSFYVGGFVDFGVSGKFHVQPELLYSMEGAKDEAISYLKVPIMAKYYVADAFSIQAGPYIGFKAGADDTIDDGVKSMDFGIGVGVGYELPMGLMFDARYNMGLQNISEDDAVDVKNTGFQIGLGYRF